MKCKACGKPFEPTRPLQRVCGFACALNMATAVRLKRAQAEAKRARAETRQQREALKPRSQWIREAQTAFNAFIRARDVHLLCISCNRDHEGLWHAGHYLSTGARPELRFDEANCFKQCQPCNTHLHGNLLLYRAALIRRMGLAQVERLEGPHDPKKYDVSALRHIRDTYRSRARELAKAPALHDV